MDKHIKNQIKTLVNSGAWQYIEDMFTDEILEGKKPINFKTEGKTTEMIALEAMARELAAKKVDSVLKKLKRIKGEVEFEKEDYI